MRIRFSPRARADLQAILRHVSRDNPIAAVALVGRIEALVETLRAHPHAGQRTQPGPRWVITVPRLPYHIFYSVRQDEILILTVRHTSRRPIGS